MKNSLRVHLVNPTSDLKMICGEYARFHSPIPPTSIAKLAAVIREQGHTVAIFDQFATKDSSENFSETILVGNPDIIGFSVLSPAMPTTQELITIIRKKGTTAKIVFGNTHATIYDEDLIRLRWADFIIRGEGELAFADLLDCIANDGDFSTVLGLSWRDQEKTVRNPDRPQIDDLDKLPYPAWDLLDLNNYRGAPLLAMRDIVLPVQAARGCPYRCIYCAQDKVHKRFLTRSPAGVADEIAYMHSRYGVSEFGFIDAFFPSSVEYGLDFAEELARRQLPIKFSTETRVDRVDGKMLKALAEVGLHAVMFGFEVGDPDILATLNKKQNLEQCYLAMRAAKASGVTTVGFFVVGLPGETIETIQKTIRFAIDLDVDIAKFNMAIPFPGTEFYRQVYGDEGDTRSRYEQFSSWYSGDIEGYSSTTLSSKKLRRLQDQAMLRFYARPTIVWRHLRKGTISIRDMLAGAWILIRRGLFHSL
jgi:radical SAM superfamily enzyme YgiQ (UPF0313 family)